MAEETSESVLIKNVSNVMINTKHFKNYFNWFSKAEQFK